MNMMERKNTDDTGVRPAPNGPRIYNLFPLLVGTVSAWSAELRRIASMGFDWVYLNPFHETGGSGSLYAVKDPFRLDPRFRDQDGGDDDEQIRRFVRDAQAVHLSVMTDLVINHTAKDAHLALERPDLFQRDEVGELASPFAVDPDDPTKKTVWGDLAELDYHDAQARAALIPYWDGYIARLQALGVKGFRCDAAYKVPPEVWEQLISAAKGRDPTCVFAAETLGCTFDEARATAGAGFDFLFNSFAWWDLKAPWALDQYEALRTVAPSIAFPENHDMPRLAAGLGREPERIAQVLMTRYALAAFFSTGVLMPVGYEWGFRRPLHVVETTPQDREATGIDISDFIATINQLRPQIPPLNREGAQWAVSGPDAAYVALLRFDAGHPEAAQCATLVVANVTSEAQSVEPADLLERTGGLLEAFHDRTPGAAPVAFKPGRPLTLAPQEVRVFVAERALPPKVRGRARPPTGEGRMVIESVSPEIDNGRTPIKRVVGERVEVSADIFTDGHEKYAAAIMYRALGETQWQRAPMHFVDNDRWAGRFPVEKNTRYQYTIEAWRDPFATWSSEIQKKRSAGQNVRLETIEGIRIVEKAASLAEGPDAADLSALLARLRAAEEGSSAQLELLLDPHNADLIDRSAERQNLTIYEPVLEVVVDRLAARFSAWYELFPRSQSGDPHRHGTFETSSPACPM